MKTDKAGRLNPGEKTSKACTHNRIVDDVLSEDGKRTGELECKECGAVFPEKEWPSH